MDGPSAAGLGVREATRDTLPSWPFASRAAPTIQHGARRFET